MKDLINKALISNAGWEAVTLRVPTGIILAAHGSQKLFGWFGGYGLEGTGQWMASVGLNPGYTMALLAGSAEFFGDIALIIGLMTRPAATISAITMMVALFGVHWGKGFFLEAHGIEYALALLSATVTLMLMGGGRYSLDNYLIKNNVLGGKDE
jgi:putative oxidoreductase